jgi:hypothetical protein
VVETGEDREEKGDNDEDNDDNDDNEYDLLVLSGLQLGSSDPGKEMTMLENLGQVCTSTQDK